MGMNVGSWVKAAYQKLNNLGNEFQNLLQIDGHCQIICIIQKECTNLPHLMSFYLENSVRH